MRFIPLLSFKLVSFFPFYLSVNCLIQFLGSMRAWARFFHIFYFFSQFTFKPQKENNKKTKKNRTWAMWWRILNRFAETIVPKLSWCLHVRVLMLPQILRIQFIIQTHREIIMIKKTEKPTEKRRCISKWDDAPCSPVHHHSNWCTRGNDQPNERTQAKQQTTTLCTSQ